jgi:ferredoxin-type protein NapG
MADPPIQSDPNEPTPAEPKTPASPLRDEKSVRPPGQRRTGNRSGAKRKAPPADDRRDFFSDAMRETLAPFAGLIERKINPLLAALEAIPNDVERLTNAKLPHAGRTLDQPSQTPPAPAESKWSPAEATAAGTGLRFLRPPGAATGGQFETLCTQCGRCVEVCPAHAIQMDQYGLLADRLPYVLPSSQPCVVCDSLACMKECPTGALKLVDRLNIHMGTARVHLDLCVRETGEDCRICLDSCPIMGEGAGPEGGALFLHAESGRVRVRRRECVGCGLCESRCPTRPAAITVHPHRPAADVIVA